MLLGKGFGGGHQDYRCSYGNYNPAAFSLEEYNSLKETEYIMSSEQTMNDIRKGEEDLKAGRGIEVNLDEL